MFTNARHLHLMISWSFALICLLRVNALKAESSVSCTEPVIKDRLTSALVKSSGHPSSPKSLTWNEGQVRAWDDRGGFYSMPLQHSLASLEEVAKVALKGTCMVHVASRGGFTIRFEDPKTSPQSNQGSLIRRDGAVLGVLQPSKNEYLMILYPARIAAAIASQAKGKKPQRHQKLWAEFTGEMDLEYNFGGVTVATSGGVAKMPLKDAKAKLEQALTDAGYEKDVRTTPESRDLLFMSAPFIESFWLKKDGIARLEIEKIKNGQVRFTIHETTQ
jgi:hypothetical protein